MLFAAPTVFELLSMKLNAKDIALDKLDPGLPAPLRPLLESMLAMEPNKRPSMQDVHDVLGRILEEGAKESVRGPHTVVSPVPEDAMLTASVPSVADELTVSSPSHQEPRAAAGDSSTLDCRRDPAYQKVSASAEQGSGTKLGFPVTPVPVQLATVCPVAVTSPPGTVQQEPSRRPRTVAVAGLVGILSAGLVAGVYGWTSLGAAPEPPSTGAAVVQSVALPTVASTAARVSDVPVIDVTDLPGVSVPVGGGVARAPAPSAPRGQPPAAVASAKPSRPPRVVPGEGTQPGPPAPVSPSTVKPKPSAKDSDWGF